MAKLEPYTKVSVSFKGTVVERTTSTVLGLDKLADGFVFVQDENGVIHALWHDPDWLEVNVVKVDEPEYEDGEVYQDGNGSLWLYDTDVDLELPHGQWYTFASSYAYGYEVPVRPLTKIQSVV